MFRPRFKTLYTGEWPYGPRDCVGLRMEGAPRSDTLFVGIITTRYKAPEAVAQRILADLKAHGTRDTTVRAHLNFDALNVDLRKIGVKLRIIPPVAANCKMGK
jgi:hypothetical protein